MSTNVMKYSIFQFISWFLPVSLFFVLANADSDPVPVSTDLVSSIVVMKNQSVVIVFTDASPSNGIPRIISDPIHGTMKLQEGMAMDEIWTYTPNANYIGLDELVWGLAQVGGGVAADLSLRFIVMPAPPVANDQSVTTDEDTVISITLAGIDADGDNLTYTVVTQPSNGALIGTAPNITYTPKAEFQGNDSFTFKVNDGVADSNVATVSITVTAVNDPPVATAQTVTTAEDTAVAITLAGTDADGDTLTYTVVDQPSNGTLSGTAPNLTYTPNADYNGNDSFTFKVNDFPVDSEPAIVSITVTAVNDPPVATAQTVTTDEDTAVAITLAGTDAGGDGLTYTVVDQATNGVLSGTAPNLTYTPNADYNGDDSFTFKVNDGTVDSEPATVSITVTGVNDPPVATAQSVTTNEDTAVFF